MEQNVWKMHAGKNGERTRWLKCGGSQSGFQPLFPRNQHTKQDTLFLIQRSYSLKYFLAARSLHVLWWFHKAVEPNIILFFPERRTELSNITHGAEKISNRFMPLPKYDAVNVFFVAGYKTTSSALPSVNGDINKVASGAQSGVLIRPR